MQKYIGKSPRAGTQRAGIKKALEQGHTLTPLEALSLFGSSRLAAQIEFLRRRGMPIRTILGRDCAGRAYARYSLDPTNKSSLAYQLEFKLHA